MGLISLREAFGRALVEAGKKHKDILVISCDLKGATKTNYFFEEFPERSFEVGIAEANGLGISAGLALSGYRPFISSFASFITGKNVEIRTSIAYNKAPVVIIGTHGGLIGPDGTTQAGLQDITTMRAMPNFILLQPASPRETKAIIEYLAQSRDLAYVRIARNEVPEIYSKDYKFVLGKGYVLREGADLTVISSGPPVHTCLKAAQKLKEIIDVRVVNMPTLKPVDKAIITQSTIKTEGIVTVEDHTTEGGLGSIVCEVVAEQGLTVPVYRHGIYDTFTESGSPAALESKYKLDTAGICNVIERFYAQIPGMKSEKATAKKLTGMAEKLLHV